MTDLMEDVYDTLERLYNEQYNHPIQTRPRPKPGVTGEEPGDIHVKDFKDEGGNTSYSAKRVNRSKNREIEDDDENDEDKFEDQDEEEGDEEDKEVSCDAC